MPFKIGVEVPAYCAVPYNNTACIFLEYQYTLRLFSQIRTARCKLYSDELKQANDAFYGGSGILIPCAKCKEARKI